MSRTSRVQSRSKIGSKAGNQQDIRHPIWEFDSENDASTVICQELQEGIINDFSINMLSFRQMIEDSDLPLNKSDTCLIVCAAISKRVGLESLSTSFLAESNQVKNMFKKLKLDDNEVLQMFCILISVLSPEIVKSIEMAIHTSMSRMSSRSVVSHTRSRVTAAMRGVTKSQIATDDEMSMAGFNARVATPRQLRFVAATINEGIPEETVLADDSVSVRNARERQRERLTNDDDDVLTEVDLMRMIQTRKTRPDAQIEDDFPYVPRPLNPTSSPLGRGLGFNEILQSRSNNSTDTNARNAMKIRGGNYKKTDLSQRVTTTRGDLLVQDFLNMQLAETEDEHNNRNATVEEDSNFDF